MRTDGFCFDIIHYISRSGTRLVSAEQDNVTFGYFFHRPQIHRPKGADARTFQSADNKD